MRDIPLDVLTTNRRMGLSGSVASTNKRRRRKTKQSTQISNSIQGGKNKNKKKEPDERQLTAFARGNFRTEDLCVAVADGNAPEVV